MRGFCVRVSSKRDGSLVLPFRSWKHQGWRKVPRAVILGTCENSDDAQDVNLYPDDVQSIHSHVNIDHWNGDLEQLIGKIKIN